MQPDDTLFRSHAAAWAARTGDPAFADWEGFTAWLEADPRHAPAYDAAVMAGQDAADALRSESGDGSGGGAETQPRPLAVPPAANDTGAAPVRWARPALAAAVAGLAALGAWQAMPAADRTIETAPGVTRTVALADGGEIVLSGGSRVVLEGGEDRRARLEAGRALFTIRHDAANPFVLTAGRDTLVDAGTVFDVALGRDRLDVAVAEGAVIVNPDTVALRLDPGEQATRTAANWRETRVDPAEVGEWRQGRITFRGATVADIADQLRRATGVAFSAAPNGAPAPLSGSVDVSGVRRDPASLGPLLGLSVRRDGPGWVLSSP